MALKEQSISLKEFFEVFFLSSTKLWEKHSRAVSAESAPYFG